MMSTNSKPTYDVDPRVSDRDVENKLPHESEHLEALQRMRTLDAYYEWSLSLLSPWAGKRILDAGCGIGNGSAILARQADYVLAADLSPQNVEMLTQRFKDEPKVEPLQVDLDMDLSGLSDRRFDTVLCMDVLEHIEDDVALLQRFHDLVQPGGSLLIKVPALMWLYGSVDVASDHFRRYNRRNLADTAKKAGWEPVRTHYMNIFGVAPYFWKSRMMRRQKNLSRTFTPKQLNRIGRIIPMLRKLDRFIGPPIGQSVVLVAKKPVGSSVF